MTMLSLFSCGKQEKEDPNLDNSIFFDITYQTTATRIESITDWTANQGIQEMRYFIDTINVEGVDCTPTENSGCFRFHFNSYKEPQLFNTGFCSGGFEGTFTLREELTSQDDEDTADQPYNPLNPYNPPSSSGGDDTEIDEENRVYTYVFDLQVHPSRRSMSSGCTSISPLDSFTLRIIRYPNGDLIVTNYSRSMEYYMVPKLNK